MDDAQALDDVVGMGYGPTPWHDHWRDVTSAESVRIQGEEPPRGVHRAAVSNAELTYENTLATLRFDRQHDRNVENKATAINDFDESLIDQTLPGTDDAPNIQQLKYVPAAFEPQMDNYSAWDAGPQSQRHWAIQGYEKYPGWVPVVGYFQGEFNFVRQLLVTDSLHRNARRFHRPRRVECSFI